MNPDPERMMHAEDLERRMVALLIEFTAGRRMDPAHALAVALVTSARLAARVAGADAAARQLRETADALPLLIAEPGGWA